MTNKYTIEELKEKVLSNIDKESEKAGLPSLSHIINDDLDELLPLVDNGYKELIKEKLIALQYEKRGGVYCAFRVQDIEELFNIKLK